MGSAKKDPGIARIEWIALAACAALLCVVLPALNAAGLVSNFTVSLWGKYLCYATLAISVDLLWGYTGLLTLGQCLFFALGGYMFGMHLILLAGPYGQYAQSGQNPNGLPDFMVFLGLSQSVPTFWKPFYNPLFAIAMIGVVPGLLALVFGYLAFRSRIKGVYFSILTQALTYAACLMFFRNDIWMGGNNGLTDFKTIFGADIRSAETQRALFACTGALLVGTYALCRWLTLSRFGKIQRAIRDSENRVLFSGYATGNFKLFVFVLSAVIAGLAGALYVPQVGIINPSEMSPEKSLEVIVWVAVGGRGTLIGPVLGAIGVNALKSAATRAYPDYWLLILGSLFILVVLFLPRGIWGVVGDVRAWIGKRFTRPDRPAPEPAPAASPESP